jgi:hypothetical protein
MDIFNFWIHTIWTLYLGTQGYKDPWIFLYGERGPPEKSLENTDLQHEEHLTKPTVTMATIIWSEGDIWQSHL